MATAPCHWRRVDETRIREELCPCASPKRWVLVFGVSAIEDPRCGTVATRRNGFFSS